MPDQAVRLILGGDADAANPGIERIGEGKIDDARFAAEMDRGFCPPIREFEQSAAPAAGGSLFDTLKGYWWVIALLLLVLVGIAASRVVRSRRAAQFDDSLGRLAVAGAASEPAFASS